MDATSTENSVSPPWCPHKEGGEATNDAARSQGAMRLTRQSLFTKEIYQRENWLEDVLEILFRLKLRGATVRNEIFCGVIHYISCLYALTVIPHQLISANYAAIPTIVNVCFCMGLGCILCGLFSNLPFVVAPPTAVSIFLSVSVRNFALPVVEANIAVMATGALLLSLFIHRPFGKFVSRLIPRSIQVGTAIGIGLLTCLAGAASIDMVVTGQYTILSLGKLTSEIYIALAGLAVIVIALHYHVKGAFCLALIFCSLVWWISSNQWPTGVFAVPYFASSHYSSVGIVSSDAGLLMIEMLFLSLLYLNGLMVSLSNLAHLSSEEEDNPGVMRVPRSRWVYIMCGIFTIISGYFSGPPVLISAESGAAIKAGAKTGLSSITCGILFLLSMFMAPLFECTPSAGTAPLLMAIGILLFQNCANLDWKNATETAPAYVVLFFIPFTYSLITGIVLGYLMYVACGLYTGRLYQSLLWMCEQYSPALLAPMCRQAAMYYYLYVVGPLKPFLAMFVSDVHSTKNTASFRNSKLKKTQAKMSVRFSDIQENLIRETTTVNNSHISKVVQRNINKTQKPSFERHSVDFISEFYETDESDDDDGDQNELSDNDVENHRVGL